MPGPSGATQALRYSKGQRMLETLEHLYGREAFDDFMANYFNHFAFQAISTEQNRTTTTHLRWRLSNRYST